MCIYSTTQKLIDSVDIFENGESRIKYQASWRENWELINEDQGSIFEENYW